MWNKRLTSGMLCLLLALSMSACSQTNAPAETDAPLVTEAPADASSEDVREAASEAEEGSETAGKETKEAEAENQSIPQEEKAKVKTLHMMTGVSYDYEWDDDAGVILAQNSYPILRLTDKDKEANPALAAALDQLNFMKETAQKSSFPDLVQDAKSQLKFDASTFMTFKDIETVSVRRCDTNVVSIIYEDDMFFGGNHNNTAYWGYNIDTATGHVLEVQEVVNDLNALGDIVQNELNRLYPDTKFLDGLDMRAYFQTSDHDISWTVDYHGVTFYFNPNAVSEEPYEVQVVTLPYDAFPGLFNETYVEGPASYGVDLTPGLPFLYDVNRDGVLDSITMESVYDDWDYILEETIRVNNKSVKENFMGYAMDPVLMHLGDGRDYLYLQVTSENDYRSIYVYDLNAASPQKVNVIYSGQHSEFDESISQSFNLLLTDPGSFRLDTRTEVLSTCTGTKLYRVSNTGMPETPEEMYHILQPIKLRLKQDMKLTRYEDGKEAGKTKVRKGTALFYTATNNKKIAELKKNDGTTFRVKLKNVSWPKTIGDQEIGDIFDGIIFAG